MPAVPMRWGLVKHVAVCDGELVEVYSRRTRSRCQKDFWQRNEAPTIAVHQTTGDYARGGIANWRDLVAMAALVRSSVGVSPSVWEEAVCVMGKRQAATVVTAIL
jgi:hypothetical protein